MQLLNLQKNKTLYVYSSKQPIVFPILFPVPSKQSNSKLGDPKCTIYFKNYSFNNNHFALIPRRSINYRNTFA